MFEIVKALSRLVSTILFGVLIFSEQKNLMLTVLLLVVILVNLAFCIVELMELKNKK